MWIMLAWLDARATFFFATSQGKILHAEYAFLRAEYSHKLNGILLYAYGEHKFPLYNLVVKWVDLNTKIF